jgi:hypothetical protein
MGHIISMDYCAGAWRLRAWLEGRKKVLKIIVRKGVKISWHEAEVRF